MGIACCCPRQAKDPKDCDHKFKVTNVDDDGKKRCPGTMALTDSDIVFHLKRGGFVKWPYFSLIRYGYDSNVFSFICGRRCQTGGGIFAFRCDHAEELFDMLQKSMQRNRISVVQNTELESMGSEFPETVPFSSTRLPYRSGKYPSFANAASSRRPEPIGGENLSASCLLSAVSQKAFVSGAFFFFVAPTLLSGMRPIQLGHKKESNTNLLLERRSADCEKRLPFEEQRVLDPRLLFDTQTFKCPRLTFFPRPQVEREELETLESRQVNRDSNCTFWDTGYDSDERREVTCVRQMGYENLPSSRFRRNCVTSVSSSDSQNYSIAQRQSALLSDDSLPSSPSIFEEKLSVGEKPPSPVNSCNNSRRNRLKRNPSSRDSLTNRACAPMYFNFDIRQPGLDGRQLNYIQVDLESSCDSDNPQTPQSPPSRSSTNQFYSEVDLEKTAALSRIHNPIPWDDGTRKTRHSHVPM